jgi:hypothetical protein
MSTTAIIPAARTKFHASLLQTALKVKDGIPGNADSSQSLSINIALGILKRIGQEVEGERLAGQTSGNEFEDACAAFLEATFLNLGHLRPGKWKIERLRSRSGLKLADCEQYSHLISLAAAAKKNVELAAALGNIYLVAPDIIISRSPEPDSKINETATLVNEAYAKLAPLRESNKCLPLLHASISCKWTIRSDRSQNARSEALNLIRNRKGHLPHTVVVVGEPVPSRIASIALGTGDIDCLYHFALPELLAAVDELGKEDAAEMLQTLVQGKRLKDISDLPLDLAI